MLKSIKLFSFSAMAVLMIVGCQGGSSAANPNDQQTESKVPEDIKSFVKALRGTSESMGNLPEYDGESQYPSSDGEIQNCSNGGEMRFVSDLNSTQMTQNQNDFNITTTSEAINCIEQGTTSNGKIQTIIQFKDGITTSTTTFLTDFTIKSPESNITIKKDSSVLVEGDITTENMEIVVDGKTFKSINLKSKSTTDDNDLTHEYDISGKEIIDGKTYIVDESYDASQTPMVYDDDDNLLKGGKARYKNEQNQTIYVEAVDKNKIEIALDEDGDGKVDSKEIIDFK